METPSGSLRNTLVLITRRLSAIPEWLVAENPAVAVVTAEKPGAAERAEFVLERRAQFHDGAALAGPAAQNAARVLANLADGMTIRELIALSATSRAAEIPLTASKRLILHHRFGLRQDPWEQLDAPRVAQAKDELAKRVMGQPAAIRTVAEQELQSAQAVGEAAAAAEESDNSKVVVALRRAGNWALSMAGKVSAEVAKRYLEQALGLPPG